MFIVGIIVAVSSNRPQAIFAGAMLALVFSAIGLYHSYLFTRKKYVRIFAYVARREKNRRGLKRELSTFIIFPDASERELFLGKKKLNIGAEYAFYFAQTNGTVEPNCHIIYGYEPASQADEQIAFNNKIMKEQAQCTTEDTASSPNPQIIEFPSQEQ